MDNFYNNVDNYNLKRNRKILIVFDDMIADIKTNEILFQTMIEELFCRCKKLIISLAFMTQPNFLVPKDIRLNSTHYLIMKINNKRELQNVTANHSTNINYKSL